MPISASTVAGMRFRYRSPVFCRTVLPGVTVSGNNSIKAGDRLPFGDRKCPVFISDPVQRCIQEKMPGYIVHGSKVTSSSVMPFSLSESIGCFLNPFVPVGILKCSHSWLQDKTLLCPLVNASRAIVYHRAL